MFFFSAFCISENRRFLENLTIDDEARFALNDAVNNHNLQMKECVSKPTTRFSLKCQ